MSGQNASAREPGSFLHEFVNAVLSFAADNGHILEIDDQLASLQSLARAAPCSLQFRQPWLHELSFNHKATLSFRIDGRNFQHVVGAPEGREAIRLPKATVVPALPSH